MSVRETCSIVYWIGVRSSHGPTARDWVTSYARKTIFGTFSIFDDLVFYTAPDSQVVGLDARTGELRWQSKVDSRGNSSGTIMAGDKVISGGSGCGTRASCYI